MSRTIYKYPLQAMDVQTIRLPKDAEILTVQVQHGEPMLWAIVDPDEPTVPRTIFTVGTGHPMTTLTLQYVGTYQLNGGSLVFHVFE